MSAAVVEAAVLIVCMHTGIMGTEGVDGRMGKRRKPYINRPH
jgi:hypothetical protein